MSLRGERALRPLPVGLGVLALAFFIPLLVWDASPDRFPARAHQVLAASPLALIAIATLAHQFVRRAGPAVLAKATILALAFMFWAANQMWPDGPLANLFNDIAIVGFVVDVFLVIVQSPSSPSEPVGGSATKGRLANTAEEGS